MATNIFKNCTNTISGETFKTISVTEASFVMRWTVQPKGYVPFEHIHLNQDELFHVEKGEMKIAIDGREFKAQEGETIIVPKGKRHIASNAIDQVLICQVEYRPALDHETFMQCFMGLIYDGLLDKKGGVDIPRMGYFLTKMNAKCMTRPTEIPAFAFHTALKLFYAQGLMFGWQKLFEKYTGNRSDLAIS